MNISIINIGDELLIGQVVNTNSSWMAQELNINGFAVNSILVVGDTREEIVKALEYSFAKSDIVLITGGLGPTNDDITKKVLCEYFEDCLVLNNTVLDDIKTMFASRNYALTAINIKQAEVPEKSVVFRNKVGTAPGILLQKNKKVAISMPGVPFEMKDLMLESVIPYLKKQYATQQIVHKTILTQGIGESALAEQISEWEANLPEFISLAYLPSPGIVRLRLSSYKNLSINVEELIISEINKLEKIIPEYIYGFDNDTLESIIGKILTDQNKSLSIAESCTGGNIAQQITSIPGSSKYFLGSVTAYSNEVKINLLKVEREIIEKHGAVSKETAIKMAEGVRKLMDSDFSIATTGIAGPDGGTTDKPVGTVWIAVASRKESQAIQYKFGDNRNRNITRATINGLNYLRKFILKN